MSNSGDCFVVLPPITKTVIFGRNSLNGGEVQEVLYFPSSGNETAKCDSGAEIERTSTLAIIVQKSTKIFWGSESGANEKHVCVSVVWSDGEPNDENSLKSTDIVRLTLENSSSALEAVDKIGELISQYGNDNSKFSFALCDLKDVWVLSTSGKLWAAEQIIEGYRRIPSNGLAVTTKIDKSTENLGDKLKDQGVWDGSDELNFSKSFSALPETESWPSGEEPSNDDGSFNIRNMISTLRSVSSDCVGSSNVSSLLDSGISCHWFTATPNPCESVYKPFVFSPNPKCSPLTKLPNTDDTETLLHKLHSQRNWDMVGELLKSLESSCIDEVNQFLSQNPEPNQELDELMKDCVEAEVKFYR